MSRRDPAAPPLLPRAVAYPLAFLVCAAAALLGSWFTAPHLAGWYATLVKPRFTPPDAVFPIAWPVFFAMMAVSAARIATLPGRPLMQPAALLLFGAQLILDVAWSAAFFGRESPAAGMLVVIVLIAAVATTVVLFWRLDRPAGALLVPYLAWLGFAGVLNASIVALN